MADEEKIYKVIMASPEMSRAEKIFWWLGYLLLVWVILPPGKKRRG